MQVTSEAVSGVTRRLNVSVPTSRVNEQFEARLKRTAKTVKINGFRPGKVPVNVVRREYGAGIYQEVVSDIIRDTVFEAIQQEKINAVGMPNIEKSELKDDALVYEATVEVYPEVNVKFDGLEVERKASEVNDKDVDQMIENLQKQRASWAETKGMAKKDMQVTFDFEGSVDGEKFEGGSAEDFKLVLGSGRMIPGFEDGIVGMKKGEEKVIDVTFPEDYQAENLAGKSAQFKITVKLVEKQKLPENFSYHYEVIRNLKKEFHKDITLLVDTCLCSITPDGHCGISHKRKIDLNQTHYALGLAANTYLEAGADIIAPSDMMKNTTRYLRKIFQDNNFSNAQIMSYSTKFKSSFYGPFRNAANSSPKGFDRSSYQLPVNHRKKAVESSIVNAAQGANYLMVKPGMTSIDLIADIKKETLLPTGAYQVSGEFASLQLLHKNKLGNYQDLLLESLQVFARAKADFIITYGARDIAKYL